jgi:hypothetical protein
MITSLIVLALWLAPAILLGGMMLISLRRDALRRVPQASGEYAGNHEPANSAEYTDSQIPVANGLLRDVRVRAESHTAE